MTLSYTSSALLETDAGIQDESNTAMGINADVAATRTGSFGTAGVPKVFEGWIRSDIVDANSTIYDYTDGSRAYGITIGVDGLLHATSDDTTARLCCQHATLDGPSTQPITDGLWHYVVVDFAANYIYVDLVRGPAGVVSTSSVRAAVSTTGMDLGGVGWYGELDEVALYAAGLTTTQMSSHASAGGLGWDDVADAGGEESSSRGCPEHGVFWTGYSAPTGGVIAASGAINFISTSRKRGRCGKAVGAGRSHAEGGYTTGQTVRVKFGPDINKYVEFGPVQYKCNPTTACWGLYFNYKDLAVGINYSPFAYAFPTGCSPVGTHAYKLQHVGIYWIAYFSCSTSTLSWVEIARHTDDGSDPSGHWTTGMPDVEAFEHGWSCGAGAVARGTCWTREMGMTETHSHFQWIDGSGATQDVPYARCRYDTSYRSNGQQTTTTPPVTVDFIEQHQNNPGIPGQEVPSGC